MADVGAAARTIPEPRRRVAQAIQGETKRGRREGADPRLIKAVDLPPANAGARIPRASAPRVADTFSDRRCSGNAAALSTYQGRAQPD